MKRWQVYLNLLDCRIIQEEDKKTSFMAEVTLFDSANKLFRYRIGDDFGATPVTPESLEQTAIHETLHIRLHPLIEAVVAYGAGSAEATEREHEIVIVLETLLQRFSCLLAAAAAANP
jgi:hypothetical protein